MKRIYSPVEYTEVRKKHMVEITKNLKKKCSQRKKEKLENF